MTMNKMTICKSCNEEKGINCFAPHRLVCRICDNLKKQKRLKEKVKPEFIICITCNKQKTEFRINRKKCLDCEREFGRNYRKTTDKAKVWVDNNKEKMAILQHKSYEKNKKEICKKRKDRLNTDLLYKLCVAHRTSLRQLINNSCKKSKYVNCSSDRLINWIQYQFTDGMTLENHGDFWTIDHILPIKLFLSGEVNEKIILNWVNVKPVVKEYNLKKNQFLDKNQCVIHLENLKNYYKIRNLKVDIEYLQELEKSINRQNTLMTGNP